MFKYYRFNEKLIKRLILILCLFEVYEFLQKIYHGWNRCSQKCDFEMGFFFLNSFCILRNIL